MKASIVCGLGKEWAIALPETVMHMVSPDVEQHWAISWGSPVGHAVGQLVMFGFPMKARVSKPVTPSLRTTPCSEALATLTDHFDRLELSPCTAGCAASTVGAKGREARTKALGLHTLYVRTSTSMARSKALIAISAIILSSSGQDTTAYPSSSPDMSKDRPTQIWPGCMVRPAVNVTADSRLVSPQVYHKLSSHA